jgi:hypothetical protein
MVVFLGGLALVFGGQIRHAHRFFVRRFFVFREEVTLPARSRPGDLWHHYRDYDLEVGTLLATG